MISLAQSNGRGVARGASQNRRRPDFTTGAEGSFLADGLVLARYVAQAEHDYQLSSIRPADFGINGVVGFGMDHANRRYEDLERLYLLALTDGSAEHSPDEQTLRKARALTDITSARPAPLPSERQLFCRFVVGVHFGIGKDCATTARALNAGASSANMSDGIRPWHVRNALINQAKRWLQRLLRVTAATGGNAILVVQGDAISSQLEAAAISAVLSQTAGVRRSEVLASGEILRLYREALEAAQIQGSIDPGVELVEAMLGERVALLRSFLPKGPL